MAKGLMTVKEARNMAVNIRRALLKGMSPGTGQMAVFSHAILALDRQLKEIEKILKETGHVCPDEGSCCRIEFDIPKADSEAIANGGVVESGLIVVGGLVVTPVSDLEPEVLDPGPEPASRNHSLACECPQCERERERV